MLTLNQIVSQITNLAAAHNQIAESGVGDFAEWQAKERSYPILWVFHESTSVNQMEIAFSIRLICADRVIVGEEGDNTEGHEQEVLSDTLLVLLDFLAYFQQNHSQPYNVVTSATIDPFTERLNDRLAGNSVTIQIRQPFDWNKCQIPQVGAAIPPSVDGLTLYNFCDPAVLARLTSAQVACLQSEYALPADITINSAPFGSAPSGGTFNIPVINGGSNPVGSEQSGEWVIGNSTVTINGTQVGDIEAEDSLPIAVELDGNPSGTWNAGTQTWEVTSAPCADATFSIDGTQVDTIASGADLDVSVELNGLPVTPTYNSGTKVIGVTALAGVAVAVTLSDPMPDFGDTITITATPTGFTPTSYQFLLFDGTITLLAQQAGNTLNWTVNVQIGSYDIYVLATDGSSNAYGDTPLDVQGDVDALAFIVATGITDATIINAVDSLVVSLKNYGIWAKMKAMYPMVGGTAATHKFNLKNPLDTNAAFRLSFNGGWTHDSNGVTGNGVNTYADTFLIPFSHLIQDNTHLSVYCRNNTQTPIDMASYIGIGSNIFSIGSRQVSNLAYSEHYNGASTSIAVSNTDSRGLVMGSRVNSTTLKLYRNGSQLGATNTNTSLAAHWNALTAKMFIGNRTDLAATYTNRNYAFITIGDGLDDTEASNLYTAIQAFQTALGRQV